MQIVRIKSFLIKYSLLAYYICQSSKLKSSNLQRHTKVFMMIHLFILRGYYRCTHRNTQGCLATKQVQRMDEDQTILEITYRGNHTCCQVGKLVPPPSPQQQEEMNVVDNFWGTSSRALTSPPAGKSTQTERRSAFDLTGVDPVPDMDLPIDPFLDMDLPMHLGGLPIDSFHDMELSTDLGEVEDVVGFFS